MATPSVLNLVKFKITLDEVNDELKFEDLSLSLYQQNSLTSVKGLLWITHSSKGLIYVNSGYNTNLFTNPDTTYNNLTKTISLFGLAKGSYTVNYKLTDGVSTVVVSKTFNFQYDKPVMNVARSVNYDISQITINDISTYQIGSGTLLSPVSISRLTSLRPPLGSPMAEAEGVNAIIVAGPNIYTGNYDLSVVTNLTYQLDVWGGAYWVEWKTQASHFDSFHVEPTDSCIQGCISCIYQLSEKAALARSKSAREAEYYNLLIHDIAFYYGLYSMYEQAGMDSSYACNKIKDILRKECAIDTTPSNVPIEILPLYDLQGSGTTVITGTKWYSGSVVPSQSLGVNGDYYLNTANGYVYNKVNGVWSHIMTLVVSGQRITKLINVSYSVLPSDDLIWVNAVQSDIAIMLPNAGSLTDGKEYTFKVVNLTKQAAIVPNNMGNTVDGSPSYVFGTVGDSVTLCLRGTNWEII